MAGRPREPRAPPTAPEGSITGLDQARRNIADLRRRIDEYREQLDAIRRNTHLSDEGRKHLTDQARAAFDEYLTATRTLTLGQLDTATKAAAQRLGGVRSPDVEVCLSRAAMRVSRLIDSGLSPGEAAQILAENGDRDGLTTLRDEVPSWTAVIPLSQLLHGADPADLAAIDLS